MKAAAFGLGLLFALGLGLSGMTQPEKVLGFLDLAGAWDPSLAFVMVGAIGASAPAFWWYRRMSKPLLAAQWKVPPFGKADFALVGGAALFGVGWGLAGYCPGPALVGLATADTRVILFVGFLILGTIVARFCFNTDTARTAFDANRSN